MNFDYMKELAEQLRNPSGTKGLEVGDMMNETNIGMTLHALDLLNLSQNENVLEIGHGNAGHLKNLLNRAADIRYVGYDISKLMNQTAQELNKEFIVQGKAEFKLYGGTKIPENDQFFDKIFTVNTLYFWENPLEFLDEIYRVLRLNGIFCLTFGEKDFMETLPFTPFGFRLYNVDDVEELIKSSQFRILEIKRANEILLSKAGDKVNRKFATAVLIKN